MKMLTFRVFLIMEYKFITYLIDMLEKYVILLYSVFVYLDYFFYNNRENNCIICIEGGNSN